MDFGEARPQAVPRFGSQVEWDAGVQLPLGLALRVRNCRYTAQSIATRWGFALRLMFPQGSAVSSAGLVRYLAPDLAGSEITRLITYTQNDGNVWSSTPFSQGTISKLTTDDVIAAANTVRSTYLDPLMTQAFNRMIVVQGDLTFGRGQSWIIDPEQNTIDPVSDKPLGAPWMPNTRYRVGQVVSPSEFQTNGLAAVQGTWVAISAGHLYRCKVSGTSGGDQPNWPLDRDANVQDSTVTWEEMTSTSSAGLPDAGVVTFVSSAGDADSPIAAGATVMLALVYTSASGTGINSLSDSQGLVDATRVFVWKNTTSGPVDLTVKTPAIPDYLSTAGPLGANGAAGFQAYAFIVAGDVDPVQAVDPAFYAAVSGTLAPATNLTLSAWPSGDTMPTVNTANIAGMGNVDVGRRWMVVLFETRTEYDTGIGATAPVPVDVSASGRRILTQRIPIGPYNTIRRKCAFTVAGATSAGPYFYIDSADVENPGFSQPAVQITSTCIENNVDTTAEFNFTDTYLPGGVEVTNYFNRVELPPASDVFFSKTLGRVVYAGCKGFPSGYLVSDDGGDAEAVRVPGSQIQVSEADGDRTVCWREIRETQIACKENSGHAIVPNNGDPSTWATQRIWGDCGPVGPKAIDVGFESDAEYMIFAHRNGLYRFSGTAPQLISREMQKTWDRINWEYGYLIRVCIDHRHHEVRVLAPMDGATERNKCITMNYYYGWDDPVTFSARSGKLVPNVNGRKWSVDDIAGSDLVYVGQRYDTAHSNDVDRSNALLLCGSDGGIYTLTEGQYFDHNYTSASVGYFSEWLSVVGSNTALGQMKLVGATCSGVGNGNLTVYAQDDAGTAYPLSNNLRTWNLTATETQRDFGAIAVPEKTRFAVGFNNGGVAGAWFEMHSANLWLVPTFATRMG